MSTWASLSVTTQGGSIQGRDLYPAGEFRVEVDVATSIVEDDQLRLLLLPQNRVLEEREVRLDLENARRLRNYLDRAVRTMENAKRGYHR